MSFIFNITRYAFALVATNALFCQSHQGETQIANCGNCKPQECCSQKNLIPEYSGYNTSSRIGINSCWDIYGTASFTYWQPIQEHMELGAIQTPVEGFSNLDDYHIINMNNEYHPGFKVGLGVNFNYDDWDTYAEYTWFRGSQHKQTSLSSTGTASITPFWTVESGSVPQAQEKWLLHMDIVSWQLARSYYVGKKLSFRPFLAARAAWIRQNVSLSFTNPVSGGFVESSESFETNTSHSWAVGPSMGVSSNWMMGRGFRLYGNGNGDLLFTRYTRLNSIRNTSAPDPGVFIHQKDINCLRTHLEMELGLGWGTYFDCDRWHIDFSAGYSCQVFFDQNMLYLQASVPNNISFAPYGNLYVHGLTITARLDF